MNPTPSRRLSAASPHGTALAGLAAVCLLASGCTGSDGSDTDGGTAPAGKS